MADINSPARKKRRSSINVEEEDEGGFKFSRQSRRKTYFKGQKSTAKKKRRSSFVHGRRERKSLPAPSAKINLHQNIPEDLPPSTRLRMLFSASLQLAINKTIDNPNNLKTDYDDFHQEAKSVFEHLRNLISDTDIIDEACKLNEQENKDVILTPNPTNQKLEENALNCKIVSDKLQKEDNKWEELLGSYQKLQQDTQQELEEHSDASKNKDECPDFLSPEQHKLLSGKPTIKTILDKLDKIKETCQLQVDSVCNAVSSLKEYEQVTEPYIQKQMEQFGTQALQVITDMGTPRTLIRGQLTTN